MKGILRLTLIFALIAAFLSVLDSGKRQAVQTDYTLWEESCKDLTVKGSFVFADLTRHCISSKERTDKNISLQRVPGTIHLPSDSGLLKKASG